MKSKTTAGVLALFTGGFGGHRFYLGQIGLGVLYFLFCITFIPALIAVIDMIVFFTMSEENFNRKYNPGYTGPVSPIGSINVNVGNNHYNNVAEQLHKLAEMKDKGIITEDEFIAQKGRLLA